jgi:hypothetical protein
MKSSLLGAALLIYLAARAQAPAPMANAVAVGDEPHHHLVLENAFMRAFYVELPGHQATLLHKHDLPYVAVALGPADIINAVAGKPEVHLTMTDGQASYSKGGFSHIARTDAGMPFRNFTVELVHAQGAPRNRCVNVIVDQPLGECPQRNPGVSGTPPPPYSIKPLMETDEILVESGVISAGGSYAQAAGRPARLLLVLDQSTLTVQDAGQLVKVLHTGEVLWIAAGDAPTFVNATAFQTCAFTLLVFKDSAGKE